MNNYGATSLMIGFNPIINQKIISFARDNIPYDAQENPNDGKGIVTDPHISLLTDIDLTFPDVKLKKVIQEIPAFKINFGDISFFKNNSDVIKIDILSEQLDEIHYNLRKLIPNNYKFDEYKPHCTLAFVKKDSCDDILKLKSYFRGMNFTVEAINFNSQKGVSFPIKINRKPI